jgi:hypothetical protein
VNAQRAHAAQPARAASSAFAHIVEQPRRRRAGLVNSMRPQVAGGATTPEHGHP